jgi:hypothetical protein
MKADAEDFRRQYASLNDESLLEINRDDLVPVAQQCYDVELALRGLDSPKEPEQETRAAPPKPLENLIELASFADPSEATVARSILRFADIPCALSTDLPLAGSVLNVAYEVKLYVPSEFADEAEAILDSKISDEELAAQAEAAALEEEELEEEAEEEEAEAEEEEAEEEGLVEEEFESEQ